jgi:catechol 2,3-dioxygenase-like lactoylglutathione lyase family enzyme
MSMSTTQQARLIRSSPYFPVADVERSSTYYETVLGFRTVYAGGTPPRFAIVSRDGLAIMLRLVADASAIVPIERQGGTWDAFFWVSDAESLCDELRENGADIVYGPIIQDEYDMKEFAARDLDGHVLGFGQAWSRASRPAAPA